MKEKDFWVKIRDNLKLEFIKRIENELEPGWPDVFYMNNGYCGWMELKVEDSFPSRIDFEPAQPGWHTHYWEKGGFSYIVLYVKKTNHIYVWQGKDARKLNICGGTKEVEPALVCQMNIVGWREVYELFKIAPASAKNKP